MVIEFENSLPNNQVLALAAAVTLATGIGEEVLFRGLIQEVCLVALWAWVCVSQLEPATRPVQSVHQCASTNRVHVVHTNNSSVAPSHALTIHPTNQLHIRDSPACWAASGGWSPRP
jgi:hypothetical protein